MCGLAGIFSYLSNDAPIDSSQLELMQACMQARGPDGVGYWFDSAKKIGLVHRRLSIIDLSHAADQPMISADGRYTIVFNGEIYNYQKLKSSLEAKGLIFRTNSDTEVILQLFQDRGPNMVHELRGMFAIVIWDNQAKKLFMARDPFGIKPLYYADDGRQLYFASQVKALASLPHISHELSAAGHAGFFMFGHIPEPYTLYKSIKAFPAGCYAELSISGSMQIQRYFNLADEIKVAHHESLIISPAEKKQKLHEIMLDSVKAHLVADVPIAFFLSAGVDSSVLLALAKELGYNTQALTLAFTEYGQSKLDEMPLAKQVAGQCQVPWHLAQISEQDFLTEFPQILRAMDQPSIDGVNTYFVSQLAAKLGFKVAVSGLGADELLGGYAIFRKMPSLLKIGRFTRYLPVSPFKNVLRQLCKKLGKEKAYGLAYLLQDEASIYLLLRGLYLPEEMQDLVNADLLLQGLTELNVIELLKQSHSDVNGTHGTVQALEAQWYMRNQLLRDADWAGMAHSIEIRVPFVDIEVWRSVLRLGADANKKMLFELPHNPLPQEIISRPKSGFNIPVSQWWRALPGANLNAHGMRGWAQLLYQQFTKQI